MLQAAGPVASASASVRAASSSRVEVSRTAAATVRTVSGSSRSRRVAVSMSSRWWRTSRARVSTSAGPKPILAADVAGDHLAGLAVVAGPALADVVQQGGGQQQVGPVHPAGEPGGLHGGLHQVAVDGEAVHGVALRPAAHPLPVGHQPGDQPLGLQGLPHRDGGLAGAEQGDELFAGLGRPGHGQRPGRGGEPPYGVQRQRQAGLGGGRGGAQRQHRVAVGFRGEREHGLALLLHDAVGQRDALGVEAAAGPRHGRGRAGPAARPGLAGAQHPADLAPGDVAGVGDAAGGLVDLAQQGVGVEQAEGGGDLVLFLEGEPVGGAAGDQVQGVAGVEQPGAGLLQALRGARRRARRRRRRAARWRRAARRGPP